MMLAGTVWLREKHIMLYFTLDHLTSRPLVAYKDLNNLIVAVAIEAWTSLKT